ncbi:MAG: tryptophan synthase subunit beta [Xanthomonadaceae bacterium]|nr:tryptophan synthase subunit beta [Xanthomonadaceae bacterium]
MCRVASNRRPASRTRKKCGVLSKRSNVLAATKDKRQQVPDYTQYPDAHGRFGDYGGAYVAETLMAPLAELTENYLRLRNDPAFVAELDRDLKHYVGRPSPIYHAERLSKRIGGAQILLKREDLNHTGAHKINNTVGQALVARHMGKTRIIAETGAGQHGVASATVAARLGLECVVYMGATDIERQKINVYRMKLLGATVVPVTSGSKTLKDALNEALRDWVTNVAGTFYIIGTVAGPHPYPMMVRDFNAVVGREARAQMLAEYGRLPDTLVACVGGGSNAIGLFHPFLADATVRLLGIEAGGRGPGLGDNAASLTFGTPGVLQGSYTLILQDEHGQVRETHSVSAGLDYSGVGPEHAHLMRSGRVVYEAATDEEALDALSECARHEGILIAIETAHAFAGARRFAAAHPGSRILIGCSGRGDKDMPILQRTVLEGLT